MFKTSHRPKHRLYEVLHVFKCQSRDNTNKIVQLWLTLFRIYTTLSDSIDLREKLFIASHGIKIFFAIRCRYRPAAASDRKKSYRRKPAMLINMTELLSVAERFDFAVPAFNIGTGQLLKAVMDTCEALNAPVILAIHPEELKFQGDAFAAQCLYAAHHSRVPCVIHMDHGDKIEDMLKAIRLGFTSVMIDASHLPFEQNVAITKQVVALAHPLNISVEAELGTIGSTEGDMEKASGEIIYTDPGMAAEFVRLTDCDCLAIAIGTAHGIYPKGFVPELKLDLLSEIKGQVSVPLVLHGGSSNSDAEIAESIRRGVRKINISSDVKDAYYQELRLTLRDLVVREPFALYPASMQAAKRIIKEKIELFNAQDKIKHYKD